MSKGQDSSQVGSPLPIHSRNRKRLLDVVETIEGGDNRRTTNQYLLSEINETLKSMGIPNKKGILVDERQYNVVDQGLALNHSMAEIGGDVQCTSDTKDAHHVALTVQLSKNRKRLLDAAEAGEGESIARRANPRTVSDFQETLRSMGVPSKKGFAGNESQYNDMIDQGLADNFEDSLSGLGGDISAHQTPFNMSNTMLALPSVSQITFGSVAAAATKDTITSSLSREPVTTSSATVYTTADHKVISSPLSSSSFSYQDDSNSTDRLFRLVFEEIWYIIG